MPSEEKLVKKKQYFDKLINLIETTQTILLISVDHVGSKQMQQIRITLRGKATVLMGRNTMIRTALRFRLAETENPALEKLLSVIKGNIGFIFINPGMMDTVRETLDANVVPAAAKYGVIAQKDVFLKQGPTGLDPAQTSFFQALNIATKIVKGSIELISDVHLVKQGIVVQMSEQVLLQKLNIKPFEYGIDIKYVYEGGAVFDAKVLDLTDDIMISKFMNGANNVAAFSREIGVPTEASFPHMVRNAFFNIAALVSDIDFTFPEVKIIKEFLADPSKFASAAAPAAGGSGAATAAVAAAPVEEEEEMEFDLF